MLSCGDNQGFWFGIWGNDGIVAYWLLDYFWGVNTIFDEVIEAVVNGSEWCVRIQRADINVVRLIHGIVDLAALNENVVREGCNNAFWDAHICNQRDTQPINKYT